jgi:hypothetical protein
VNGLATKVYTQHRCSHRHRMERTFLTCAFPRAAWVSGRGPFAVMAWCGPLTVTLWPTMADAKGAMTQIDTYACGHLCVGRHEIVRVALDHQRMRDDS